MFTMVVSERSVNAATQPIRSKTYDPLVAERRKHKEARLFLNSGTSYLVE